MSQLPHRFKVGDPATYVGYSDRDAGYITEVNKTGTRVTFQYATAELLNGPNSDHPDKLEFSPGGFCGHTSGDQIWQITPNPKGHTQQFSLRKNGMWKLKGWPLDSPGGLLIAGHSHYYDFNF